MFPIHRLIFPLLATPLMAGTVVITSVPDPTHPLGPLTSLTGSALPAGIEVRIGAFPSLTDNAILNTASTGGLAAVTSAFVPFGEPCAIGQGVDGVPGQFEIAVKQDTFDPASPLIGQTVSLFIRTGAGEEFLVARFSGRVFEADSVTGLEPLLSLHLAEAKLVVGNRYATTHLSTTPTPAAKSFDAWIADFPNITDPSLRLPDADADGDGRSNFLEYATGGDPSSADDAPPFQIQADGDGVFWLSFSREHGIGSINYLIEWTEDLALPWQSMPGLPQPDPNSPASSPADWLRIAVPASFGPKGFFRLNATGG